MAKKEDTDKGSISSKISCIVPIAFCYSIPITTLLVIGIPKWEWAPIVEIEDKAAQKWVEGTCKVKSTEMVSSEVNTAERRLNENDASDKFDTPYQSLLHQSVHGRKLRSVGRSLVTMYNVKVKVKRVSQVNVDGNATLVDLDPEQGTTAWKYPYMESGNEKQHWYTDKGDAKAIKKKYSAGDVVKCYWNPSDTDEVSLTNTGGDWIEEEYVIPGKWMTSVAIVIFGCFFCCVGCIFTMDEEEEKKEDKKEKEFECVEQTDCPVQLGHVVE